MSKTTRSDDGDPLYIRLIVIFACLVAFFYPTKAITQAEWRHASQMPHSYLDETIEYLSWCESRHTPHVQIIDTNDRYSRGRFQYQSATLRQYMERYGYDTSDMELEDIINLSLDPVFTERITREVLHEGHWNNWYNCLKKIYE